MANIAKYDPRSYVRRQMIENPVCHLLGKNKLVEKASSGDKLIHHRTSIASYVPVTHDPALGYPVIRYKGGTLGGNAFLHSTDFSNAAWGKARGVINSTPVATPDGRTAACTLECTVNETGPTYFFQSVNVTAGEYYTVSVFIKNISVDETRDDRSGSDDGGAPFYMRFDGNNISFKSDGTVRLGSARYIVNSIKCDDGWYRVSITKKAEVSGSKAIQIGFYGNLGDRANFWGPQIEQSRAMNGFIKTTTSAINGPAESYLGIDCSRQEKEGWLIEATRTNRCINSESFTSASSGWSLFGNTTPTEDADTTEVIAPDGAYTATKLTLNGGSGRLGCLASVSGQSPGAVWTTSIYVKQGTASNVRFSWIHYSGSTTSKSVVYRFDFATEEFTSTFNNGQVNSFLDAGAYYVGDGWYRLFITTDIEEGANTAMRNDVGETSGTVYVWGAQVEPHYYPTSYIPTEGVSAARTQDQVYLDAKDNVWKGDKGCSMIFNLNRISRRNNFEASPNISLASDTGYFGFSTNNLNATYSYIRRESGNATFNTHGSFAYRQKYSYAVVLEDLQDGNHIHRAYTNGNFTDDNFQTVPLDDDYGNVNTLRISFTRTSSANVFCGHISDFRWYDFPLNDAEVKFLSGVK